MSTVHSFVVSGTRFELDKKFEFIRPVGHGAYGVVMYVVTTPRPSTTPHRLMQRQRGYSAGDGEAATQSREPRALFFWLEERLASPRAPRCTPRTHSTSSSLLPLLLTRVHPRRPIFFTTARAKTSRTKARLR